MKCFKPLSTSVLMLLILFSGNSCQKKIKKNVEQKQEEQVVVYDTLSAKGIILSDVKTRTDSAISFALYLPATYSVKRSWPVIFIFDAQARGKLPLELYKELAEKYGYILIGSNNSKNRVEWTVNKPEISKLMYDASGRFAIDKKRIYTMGFSGGARVACQIAIELDGITGVIGCAAGFPEITKPIDKRFCYIGFSGEKDFNHVEMVKLDENLAAAGLPYFIRFYDGKHDWPPVKIMNEGFLWLEFNSYKSNLSAKNEAYIADFKKLMDDESAKAEKSKNKLELYSSLKKTFAFLNMLTDIQPYNNQLAELERSEKLKKLKKDQQDLVQKEISKQEEYRNELSKGNIEWWKKEIGSIYQQANNKNKSAETFMAIRLKNYISLLANTYATNALAANQTEASAFFLAVYSMADPYNPDFFYLSAYFFAREKNIDQSLMFLKNAVKAGYKDKKKLQTDATFDVLRNDKEFVKILKEMRE